MASSSFDLGLKKKQYMKIQHLIDKGHPDEEAKIANELLNENPKGS